MKFTLSENSTKLLSVEDELGASINNNDFGDRSDYQYDAIGNLISDSGEEIADIEWTVSGKVKRVTRDVGSAKPDLEFTYDPMGNRVMKKVINSTGTTITYYIRDAQGNVLSTYKKLENNDINLQDFTIYGSSRLGILNINQKVLDLPNLIDNTNPVQTKIGIKYFELSNHLGNVLTTISDRKIEHGSGSMVEYYTADIVSATDYYPFGFAMDERNFSSSEYRFGFNGQEIDNELKGDGNSVNFKFRMHDPRIGRFLSVDPISFALPWNSSYSFAENDVIRAIDLEGLEKYIVNIISEDDDKVILSITLSSEPVANQQTPHGPQASFDGGKTYSTNFKYKVLQKYFRRSKFISETLYHVPIDDSKENKISTYGGKTYGHPSGTDAPTFETGPFTLAYNTLTEPRLIHVDLDPITHKGEHLYDDGPSYTTINNYNTGESSSKSLVKLNYDLMDETNTIEILDASGNVIKSFSGSGTGTLEVKMDSNTDFSIRVIPSSEGSATDGWTYVLDIQNTKEETTYDEEGYEPVE